MTVLSTSFELAVDRLLLIVEKIPFSLWQAITFFIVWVGLWLPIAIVCANFVNWRPPEPLAANQKLPLLGSLYLIAPLVLWQTNKLTGASFSDYGFVWSLSLLRSLGLGFGLGVGGIVVLFSVQTALKWLTWRSISAPQLGAILLPTLLLAVWIGTTEELIFRGFLQTKLQQDFPVALAAAISSLVFALLHLVWEQKETIPQLPGLWLMGMILVLARWVDHGSLGLASGLHSGWICAIALVDTAGLIVYTGNTPLWVTGKYEKLLAGIMGNLCLLVTGLIMLFLVHRF